MSARTGNLGERISERAMREGRRKVARDIANVITSGEQPEWVIENLAVLAYAHLLTTRDPSVNFGKAERLGRRLWQNHRGRMFEFAVLGDDDTGAAA